MTTAQHASILTNKVHNPTHHHLDSPSHSTIATPPRRRPGRPSKKLKPSAAACPAPTDATVAAPQPQPQTPAPARQAPSPLLPAALPGAVCAYLLDFLRSKDVARLLAASRITQHVRIWGRIGKERKQKQRAKARFLLIIPRVAFTSFCPALSLSSILPLTDTA